MGRFFTTRYAKWSAVAAIICGFLHALPIFAALPSQGALFSAARGLGAGRGLAGYSATPLDYLNSGLWRAGGAAWLGWGQWLGVFLGWTLTAFVALLGLRLLVGFLKNPGTGRIVCLAAAALLLSSGLLAAWKALGARQKSSSNITLTAPVELIEQTRQFRPGELFANASAQLHLLLFGAPDAGTIPLEQAGRLTANPALWRDELRQEKWQAVLLTGPLTEYRPLLDHLIASPDWHLAAVTNQGYLFRRGPGLPAESFDVETFRLGADFETAIYLAQITERYDAIQRSTLARACMDRALQLAPDNANVLAYAATFAASHKRWQDAISLSQKALAHQPDFAQAKIVQALALLEINEPARARDLIGEVLARNPDDLYTLFLSARIYRTLNDPSQEAEVLEKVIALSKSAGLPVINYQIYLGQAYARLGQAKPALENYRAVLAGGQLNKEQAAEIQDAITTIETRQKP